MGPPTSTNNSLPPLFQLLFQDVTATTRLLSFSIRILPASSSRLRVWTQALTAATPQRPGLWDQRERDCVPLRGWSGWSSVFVGSSFLSGHSRSQTLLLLQTWTACGLSVSQWPQAVEPSKSFLGTVHVAGRGCVSGICACKFLPSRLGFPEVAEKGEDRRQGTEGRRN